ncbi:MAG: hypothetical protein ACTHME_10130 [Candidatus Nitrosocosmicus sp.]
MISKKIYSFNRIRYIVFPVSKSNKNLVSLFGLFLVSFIFFGPIQNLNQANAQNSLGQSIQQFNNNLQSSINKQVQSQLNSAAQSNNNNNNNNNCNGNNLSVQSQTTINGQITSKSKSSCNGSTSFDTTSNNANLNGIISSSEYDKQTGAIINVLYGNWSLTTNTNGFTDFKALFTKQPIFYTLNNNDQSSTIINLNTSSSSTSSNIQQGLIAPQQQQQSSNITTYNLSNFRVNSLQQQNQDITYVGTINVVQTIHSDNPNQPDVTNSFNGVGIAISILNGNTLAINFDNQTPLFNEFKDIPLVGIIQ